MKNTPIKPAALVTLLTMGLASHAQAADDRYIIQVDNQNKGIVIALSKQLGADIQVDADGFIAATFAGKSLLQVKGLLNNPHVTLVEEDPRRLPFAQYQDDPGDPMLRQVTPYAVYQSQANQVNFNPDGGAKVCIIDSGLDSSNPDFVWNNISGDNDPGTGSWNEHGGPHGTHVAGTVGAADNGIGVVGMAPGVDMHIIKVFNEDGWGYSSDLAKATQLCDAAGANIISMSLGGGPSNSTESNAFQSFSDNGGLVIAAAGNDGNNVRSYPAGYSSVMMVGANDANNNIADFSQYPSCTSGKGKRKRQNIDDTICVEVTAGGVATLSTYPAGLATLASLQADGNTVASAAMENSGSASGTMFYMGIASATNTGANGQICVIDRGQVSFHDKVTNCENSGGIGAIIINNVPGMLNATLGDNNTTSIPAVGTALEDRSAILAAQTADITIASSDYGLMSGTSMATPAVSGIAALVWSNHRACSGSEIREALKVTAKDAGETGHDVSFGYGIVQAAAADAYLTANSCGGGDGGGGGNPGGGDFNLDVRGYKIKGRQTVDLTWSGASGSHVDVYRDGNIVDTTANDGAYTDNIGTKGGGSYGYQLCEAGDTTVCSNEQTVNF